MRKLALAIIAAAVTAAAPAALAQDKAEILWLGQAAFKITDPGGRVIVIDPFLVRNPKTPAQYKDLKALGKVDLILVTHAHFDHSADAGALQKMYGAKVAGNAELVRNMAAYGLLDGKNIIAYNKSGTIAPFGADGPKVHMVRAEHSSGLQVKDASGRTVNVFGGEPAGFVIELSNGFKIYHTGDTGVFGDMALIGDIYKPDLMLAAIGGHFTMGPEGAARAVGMVKPKTVIPMHYGTFPLLRGTPDQFKQALGDSTVNVMVIEPGGKAEF
jgi:L-ascorbate metabolism protein UlaG (beta-lactamase superfamily)